MAVIERIDPHFLTTGREPRSTDLVRLKLRLLKNGFRGEPWRIVAWVIGRSAGCSWPASPCSAWPPAARRQPAVGYVVAAFAGSAVVLGWALVPLLFFGVDETLDPARFALLPVRPDDAGPGHARGGVHRRAGPGHPGRFVGPGDRRRHPVRRARRRSSPLVGVVLGLTVGVVASRA